MLTLQNTWNVQSNVALDIYSLRHSFLTIRDIKSLHENKHRVQSIDQQYMYFTLCPDQTSMSQLKLINIFIYCIASKKIGT